MRKGIRRSAIIGLALVGMLAAYVCYLRIIGGQILQRLGSADGIYIAEVITTGASGATDTAYTGVMLRSRWNPFREYVFAGLDYGTQIRIEWTDSKHLLIKCFECAKLNGGNIRLNQWRDIAIRYELK